MRVQEQLSPLRQVPRQIVTPLVGVEDESHRRLGLQVFGHAQRRQTRQGLRTTSCCHFGVFRLTMQERVSERRERKEDPGHSAGQHSVQSRARVSFDRSAKVLPPNRRQMHSGKVGHQRSPPQNESRGPQRRQTERHDSQHFATRHAARAHAVQQEQPDRNRSGRLPLSHADRQRCPLEQVFQIRIVRDGEDLAVDADAIGVEQDRSCRDLSQQEQSPDFRVSQGGPHADTPDHIKESPQCHQPEQSKPHGERPVQIRPQSKCERSRPPVPAATDTGRGDHQRHRKADQTGQLRTNHEQLLIAAPAKH